MTRNDFFKEEENKEEKPEKAQDQDFYQSRVKNKTEDSDNQDAYFYEPEEELDQQGLNAGESKLLEQRKKEKRRKKIGRFIKWTIFLIIVVFVFYIYNFFKANGRFPWNPAVDTTRTIEVELPVYEENYETQIDISGYVEANQTQVVQLRTSGAVTAVLVKEGDFVHKGDLLATVDDTDQQYNLSSIQSQIAEAKINGTSSKLEQLQMQQQKYLNQLEYTRATANFDGVVIKVDASVGDYADAGDTLMTIIDSSKLKATVEVDEVDIQMLESDMKAQLTSDAVSGQTIEAYVSYIPRIGRYSNQGIGVVDVEITIDNPPEGLLPGFSFEGVISIENQQSVLLVAQSAVTTSRGVSTVEKKLSDGTTETVVVTVKYLGESVCQILSGDIKAGDTVIQSKSGNGVGNALMGMMGGGVPDEPMIGGRM